MNKFEEMYNKLWVYTAQKELAVMANNINGTHTFKKGVVTVKCERLNSGTIYFEELQDGKAIATHRVHNNGRVTI